MKVFIQGMRRSGTTIVFDLLGQDAAFAEAWYEPFSVLKAGARGGGSGVQDVDFAARVRAERERVCALPGATVNDPDAFNHGAPRAPRLELERTLPAPQQDYLRGMLERADDVLVKFVRMYDKVPVLAELGGADARLVHVVRDPRAVATSQMLGRGRVRADRFPDARTFFKQRGRGVLWASRALSTLLAERPEHRHLQDVPDVLRVLLVWRHTFRRTFDDGRAAFGSRYLRLRHEDLLEQPERTTRQLYEFLGRPLPPAVLAWAVEHVRPPGPPAFATSRRWRRGFAAVGMERELAEAGYGHLLAAEPDL